MGRGGGGHGREEGKEQTRATEWEPQNRRNKRHCQSTATTTVTVIAVAAAVVRGGSILSSIFRSLFDRTTAALFFILFRFLCGTNS